MPLFSFGPSDLEVMYGTIDISSKEATNYVEKWIINGCFHKREPLVDDIALIKTKYEIEFRRNHTKDDNIPVGRKTYVNAICLPEKDSEPDMKLNETYISGWGIWKEKNWFEDWIGGGKTTNYLQKSTINIRPEDQCANIAFWGSFGFFYWTTGTKVCLEKEGVSVCMVR